MEKSFFETLKTEMVMAARQVNDCAAGGDVNRNHVNYGVVTAYSHIFHQLGHRVDVAVWEDNGFLKIPKIAIGPDMFHFPDGK